MLPNAALRSEPVSPGVRSKTIDRSVFMPTVDMRSKHVGEGVRSEPMVSPSCPMLLWDLNLSDHRTNQNQQSNPHDHCWLHSKNDSQLYIFSNKQACFIPKVNGGSQCVCSVKHVKSLTLQATYRYQHIRGQIKSNHDCSVHHAI